MPGKEKTMKYLVTSHEMREYDTNTIEKIGIPGMVLMERAALAVASLITQKFGEYVCGTKKVLVLAGVGNNGGDGLAVARLLSESGYNVCVLCVGDTNKASEQWKQQRKILERYPVSVISQEETGSKISKEEYTILVDALFGVGLTREITGRYAGAVEDFNRRNGFKVAVDIPSGVDADNGKILGCAVKADATVTFGFCKRGLVLYPGCENAGEVVTAEIGISEGSFFGKEPEMFYLDEDVRTLVPKRNSAGNKGTFGKVLLVAGSRNMAGAAILSAKAAYCVGAGMVKVITPEENRIILQEMLPEALLGTAEDLPESMKWADMIAVGPGLGKSAEALECLTKIICESTCPLLIDADGLNLLAEHADLQEKLRNSHRTVILTPHVGELSRLTGESIAELKQDLAAAGQRLAQKLHAIVAAKDARTFVCAEEKPVCLNFRGNSGMATAGSGDVLAGIISGLLAQGAEPFMAACTGVALHAASGDAVAQEKGEYALMAGDIANWAGHLLKERH